MSGPSATKSGTARRRRPSRQTVILFELAAERERQDDKFPDQHLPSFTERIDRFIPPADILRAECEARHEAGECSWYDVLAEEVGEAADAAEELCRLGELVGTGLAAEAVAELRAELIQVAAVCVRWIEDLDRGGAVRGRGSADGPVSE